MNMMRQARWAFVAAAVFLAFTVSARAAAPDGAAAFVQDLAGKVLAIFNDSHLTRAEKEQKMYPVAVGAFDVPRTARFVLGRFWKTTPAPLREQFVKTFETYMVHVYAGQFEVYHDVAFKLVSVRPSDTATLVRTQIIRRDGGPPTEVDWWIAKEADGYRVADVTVEGVSQLVALRDEFTSVIDQHNGSVQALIDHLREKIGR
jgi:phospholipid transport system substrate-binding protein